MKSLLSVIIFCIGCSVARSQPPFQFTYGDTLDDRCYSVRQVGTGFIFVGGTDNCSSGNSIYVTKTNEFGDINWTKCVGGTSPDVAYMVRETCPAGYIVVGATESFGMGGKDAYIVNLSFFGDVLWSRTYGGSGDDVARGIAFTTTCENFISGTIELSSPSINTYAWVIRIDEAGDTIWTRTYFTSDSTAAIFGDGDGNFVLLGKSGSTINLLKAGPNGDTIWTKSYEGNPNIIDVTSIMHPGADEGYILVGSCTNPTNSTSDLMIIRLDSIGNVLWAKTYDSGQNDRGTDVTIGFNGITAMGHSNGYSVGNSDDDILIVQTDLLGNFDWASAYGDTNNQKAFSLQVTSGGLIIGGLSRNPLPPSKSRAYLIHLEYPGNSTCYQKNAPMSVGNLALTTGPIPDIGIGSGIFNISGVSDQDHFGLAQNPCLQLDVQDPNKKLLELNLSPNPFDNTALLIYPNPDHMSTSLVIYNTIGEAVREIQSNSSGEYLIERGNLANGIYFFRLFFEEEKVSSGKFVICSKDQ